MPETRFTAAFLHDLIGRARAAPRRRLHHNLHASHDEPVQRLFNAIEPDSYIRPHRHGVDPKQETLLAIAGGFALLVFDDSGELTDCVPFAAAQGIAAGVEVLPAQWHTVIATAPGSVLFEVKAGPFLPDGAKEPAPWAPEEGSAGAAAYLDDLRRRALNWSSRS